MNRHDVDSSIDHHTAATESRERPEIRNVEDFWCWLNTWGDERKHGYPFGSPFDLGYRRCIHDAMKALEAAGVSFETVPDEAWERWSRV